MVRCEVIEKFTLGNDKRFKFEDLQEIKRKDINKNDYGALYVGDEFLCNNEMALYLGGENPIKKVVVKVIEVLPEVTAGLLQLEEIKEAPVEEAKEIVKKTRGRKKKEVD